MNHEMLHFVQFKPIITLQDTLQQQHFKNISETFFGK